MAGVSRPDPTNRGEPVVHNEGRNAVTVRIGICAGNSTTTESVTLEPGESHGISASPDALIEVYAGDEAAAAPASGAPFFVVRDGRMLVAPR